MPHHDRVLVPALQRNLVLDEHLAGHDLASLRLRVAAADEEIALLDQRDAGRPLLGGSNAAADTRRQERRQQQQPCAARDCHTGLLCASNGGVSLASAELAART